jgi:hypothetical protein
VKKLPSRRVALSSKKNWTIWPASCKWHRRMSLDLLCRYILILPLNPVTCSYAPSGQKNRVPPYHFGGTCSDALLPSARRVFICPWGIWAGNRSYLIDF